MSSIILKNLGYEGYFFRNGKTTPVEQFDVNRYLVTDSNRKIIDKKAYFNNFIFEPVESI